MPTSVASGRAAVAKTARAARDRWTRLPVGWRASALVALAAVVVGAVCFAFLRPSPEPRARQYIAFKACLLTDSRGIAGAEAAPVWQGMRRASLKTRAKIQYLAVSAWPTRGPTWRASSSGDVTAANVSGSDVPNTVERIVADAVG
ncbi:hypothetical protein ACFOY4_06855 [Actinomadura syzygii]|uniref:Uncharacterized protein n=1 Tax=Actinomadura syzygii TaxID=1427538 RepID=A0A5D0TT09_9ACTN|nr:hypothetical protein [Actinomadura syzygii]TYC09318.1 hypothetical protein FXF65_34195 [Actinomadura syzygii]